MRTPIALALFVSLTAGSFAQNPLNVNEVSSALHSAWNTAREAGLEANGRQSYSEALDAFEQCWAKARSPEEQGASAHDLGQMLRRLGRIREARTWLERAYDIWRTDPEPGSQLAVAATSLSDLERSEGDYAGAERLLRKTLTLVSKDPGSVAAIRSDLAELLREEGISEEARALYVSSLEIEGISWKVRVSALIGLADLARQTGDWDSSAGRWNEVVAIARKQQDGLAEAVGLRGLATLWLDAGKPARAEPLFRRSLWMLENNPAAPPEQLATALSGMGELYRSQNKLRLAEDAWSRALQIERKELGEAHPQIACLLEFLADIYSARGEFTLARDYANRAADMLSGSFGGDSLPAAAALTNRALVEQRASDLDAAAKDYERAITIARVHPENRSLAAAMIQRYAGLLKMMHRSREAKALDLEARFYLK
jgi:tetratricopeptide (TPR) repeat protein